MNLQIKIQFSLPQKPNSHFASPCMDKGLPGFVSKLFRMVNDPTLESLIRWNEKGDSFLISNPEQFSRQVLPRYCKHNNFSSFVRQLNMYGFHKVPHLEEDNIWEFQNSHFLRDHPQRLSQIKRKTTRSEDLDSVFSLGLSTEKAQRSSVTASLELSSEISTIKMQQETIYSTIKELQAENKHLWSESLATRQRLEQQQETINKILHFLASLFSGTGIGVAGGSSSNFLGENFKIPSTSSTATSESSPSTSPKMPVENAGAGSAVIGRIPAAKRQMLLEGSPLNNSKEEQLYEDIDMLKDSISMLNDDLISKGWKDPDLESLLMSNSFHEDEEEEHKKDEEIEDVVDLFLNSNVV